MGVQEWRSLEEMRRWIFINSSVSANDFLFFCLETWSRRRITEERWSYERKQTTKNYCYSSKDSVIKLTLFYSNFLLFYKTEKKSQRAIKRKENTLKSPWELRVKISKPSKARENAGDQVVISVSFAFDWLREWREFSGPITEQSKWDAIPDYFGHSIKNLSSWLETMSALLNL